MSKTIHSIRDLIEYLIDHYNVTLIPSTKTNRLDLERHYGHLEVIQHIIEVGEVAEHDIEEAPQVAPLDFRKDVNTDVEEEQGDYIEEILKKKGYFPEIND